MRWGVNQIDCFSLTDKEFLQCSSSRRHPGKCTSFHHAYALCFLDCGQYLQHQEIISGYQAWLTISVIVILYLIKLYF